jgi:hypothetical protein
MTQVAFINGKAVAFVSRRSEAPEGATVESGWDWPTTARTETIAAQLTEATGELHIAVDHGDHVSPRWDVIRAPAVGDGVSRNFNGDSYPCGKIVKIAADHKQIRTQEEGRPVRVFYRRRHSAAWVEAGGTWALVRGHVAAQNPEF